MTTGSIKSKYTREKKEAIIKAILEGHNYRTACSLAHVLPHTGYKWLAKGKDGIEPYKDLYEDVQWAITAFEDEAFKIIKKSAKGIEFVKTITTVTKTKTEFEDSCQEQTVTCTETKADWKAAAWLLERRYPANWSKPSDFNQALSAMRSYGINLQIDENGKWYLAEQTDVIHTFDSKEQEFLLTESKHREDSDD